MRMMMMVGVFAVVAGGTLAATPPPSDAPPPPVTDPGTQGTHTLSGAAETPLRNANLVRQDIPAALIAAEANPYGRPRPLTCHTLGADIVALNGALGDDLDTGPADRHIAAGPQAVKVAANALIPWQGVVRFVSGADARDRRVRRAIIAGATRRAYLKGLGEEKGCAPPAAPFGHAVAHTRRR